MLPEVLTNGLHNLRRLDEVQLSGRWCWFGKLSTNAKLPYHELGSPAKRSWDPFVCSPLGYYWGPSQNRNYRRQGMHHFWMISKALFNAQNLVSKFTSLNGLPPFAFDAETVDHTQSVFSTRSLGAYAELEQLSLGLANFCDDPHSNLYAPLDGLFLVLNSVPKLKELRLSLPSNYVNDSFVSFQYDSIFPVIAYWPDLTTFTVEHLVIHVNQLVELLTLSLPQLRELRLEMVELVDGNWNGITELLKYQARMDSFEVCQLFHCGRIDLFEELEEEDWFPEDVEEYVCDGRDDPTLRHPGLPPDAPSHRSRDFLQGLHRDCEKSDPESFAAKMVRILTEHAPTLHRKREIQEQLVDELV